MKHALRTLLVVIIAVFSAQAHGVVTRVVTSTGVTVSARYDDATPIAHAQVNVYAPDNPRTPWLRGTTNDSGEFRFVPDHTIVGQWGVQIRQAGHGAMVHVEIGSQQNITVTSNELSSLQKGVMVLCVVWGSIGTALYFKRRSA
ncbi:hypothetical protein [Chrysiogenes arsenatis]|uniref:hypothetical protein n=1 Tax=Chrysiogenes arsenatis TaxID=309797 RepID=UPI00048284A6|nr:hypothetical protein [Chrysiogenes arsenatis]